VSGRLVSLGVATALLVAVTGAIVAACYEVPTPDCGFLCGPDNACPDTYTCASDRHCHRIGAPANLVCSTPDGGAPSTDASAIDAAIDAAIDGQPDAMDDAPAPPVSY
jgi:hypothetical protein